MNNLPNILIIGKMRSGKSTIANIIKDIYTIYTRIPLNYKQKDLCKLFVDNKDKNRNLIYKITKNLSNIDKYVWIKYIINKIKDNYPVILEGILNLEEYYYLINNNNKRWIIIQIKIKKDLQLKRIKNEEEKKHMNHKYENIKLNIKYDLIIDMDFNQNLNLEDFKIHYKTILKNEILDLQNY